MPEPHLKLNEAAKRVFPNVDDPRGTKLARLLRKAEREASVTIIHDNGRRGTGRRRWVIESEVRKHLKPQIRRTPSEQLDAMRSAVRDLIEEEAEAMFATWAKGLDEHVGELRSEVTALRAEVERLSKTPGRKTKPRR